MLCLHSIEPALASLLSHRSLHISLSLLPQDTLSNGDISFVGTKTAVVSTSQRRQIQMLGPSTYARERGTMVAYSTVAQ